jgi:CHAD domain-containing protein
MVKKPKQPAPINAHESVSDGFATILRHNFEALSQWEEAARTWDDIEGVHQLRVTLRRMRSALSLFRPVVPNNATAACSEEMRWLANQLGPARDLDVFITEAMAPVSGKLLLPGEEALRRRAEERRAAAYESVRSMLDGERYARFKNEFGNWLQERPWEGAQHKEKHRKRLHGELAPFAREVLDKFSGRVLAAGAHVDQDSAEEMHRLRIECKKLRYAAEFFTPLFAGMDEFIAHLKGLQDLLGVMHDVVIMHDLLEDLLNGEADPRAREYAGGLLGWRTCHYHNIKDSFDARWDELAQTRRPWWRKHAVIE